jgi:hypothetical protein
MEKDEAAAYDEKNIKQKDIVHYHLPQNKAVSVDNKVKTTIVFRLSPTKRVELFTWMVPQLFVPKKKKPCDSDSDEVDDEDYNPLKKKLKQIKDSDAEAMS